MKSDFKNLWLVFVNIKARPDFKFNDLIDIGSDKRNIKYKGAWANLFIKASSINEALDIIPLGLKELNFDVNFIDKIENVASLIDHKEINKDVIEEAAWLNNSSFVFKISDKIFPYK